MAAMRPLRAFSLWSISPILLSTACRISPLLYDRNGQCATYSTSSGDTFSFKIAASFSAKGSRFDSKRDVYSYLPHTVDTFSAKNKRPNSGQDSFFVVPLGRSKDIAFGVADGVGGWMDSGVDPADFSHGLCEGMKEAARGTEEGREGLAKPGRILQKGYDDIVADESIPAGGSTACVAIGRADGILEVAK